MAAAIIEEYQFRTLYNVKVFCPTCKDIFFISKERANIST